MDLSVITAGWPYDEHEDARNVRKVVGVDGEVKIQVRVRSGVVQWEADGRPDGDRPHGSKTVLAHCRALLASNARGGRQGAGAATLSSELVSELADEMIDYCRRSRALNLLGDHARALRDSLHSLAILDLLRDAGPDHSGELPYQRYRPSLLLDRARAEMLVHVQAGRPAKALEALNRGLDDMEGLHGPDGADEEADDAAQRQALIDMRRSLRERFNLPLDDGELLQNLRAEQRLAIQKENYEMAARLRDKISMVQHRMSGRE